jgi:hypothetical protein
MFVLFFCFLVSRNPLKKYCKCKLFNLKKINVDFGWKYNLKYIKKKKAQLLRKTPKEQCSLVKRS